MNFGFDIPEIGKFRVLCVEDPAPVEGEIEYQTNGGMNEDWNDINSPVL